MQTLQHTMLLFRPIHTILAGSRSSLRSVALARTPMEAMWPSEVVYVVAVEVMKTSEAITKVEVASTRTGAAVVSITAVDEEGPCLLRPAVASLRLLEPFLDLLTWYPMVHLLRCPPPFRDLFHQDCSNPQSLR